MGIVDEPFFTLLSAIYFKGDWSSKFNKNTSNKFPFYCKADATGKMIYMMEQHESLLEYSESKKIKILKMFFEGSDYSLTVVLPKKIMSARQLLTEITPEEIKTTCCDLFPRAVDVKMPKFDIINTVDLKSVLKDLGFTDMNDFTPMFERTDIANTVYIDKMKQKNWFAVDEKGAEATSVTYTQSFSIGCSASLQVPPVDFTMDRPFLFFLQHENKNHGTVLFAGCYATP